METDYVKQATDALATVGASLAIELTDEKSAPWAEDGRYRPHYRCTLKRGRKSYTFDFWDSTKAGETGEPLTAYSVIAGLEWHTPETFEDFCAEFGYDSDSRKAVATFKACRRQCESLQRVIPDQTHRDILADIR